MEKIALVTGANGHLGNNLVRRLIAKGQRVRAGVRNLENTDPFKGLNCEVVFADLLDKKSLFPALEGVDTLYQVGAVFQHWAKNPEKDIIQPNLMGTKNILEVAAQQKVRKVVYVSSITALDRSRLHMNEMSWNSNPINPYYQSKTESEKTALRLAKEQNLFIVSVLPAAMVGPHCYGRLTPTMKILDAVLKNQQPIDVDFHINFVSIEDVVEGMIAAQKKGRNGERYILGNESPVSTSDILKIAMTMFPGVKSLLKPPKFMINTLAFLIEVSSKITGKEPGLTQYMVKMYYRDKHTLDLSKSCRELGYNPKNPIEAIKATLKYLNQRTS
ncbi:MAG: NAD-dependent epimerase/dehydratase family protein [Proteobacteria bacterium]|nr:NAD-dependent epimerase/dehydratase family protein [Pseudomonadota bacterium]